MHISIPLTAIVELTHLIKKNILVCAVWTKIGLCRYIDGRDREVDSISRDETKTRLHPGENVYDD